MSRLFSLCLICILTFAPLAAQAKTISPPTLLPQVKPIVLSYDIYVGGAHLLTAEALFQEGKTNYHVRFKGSAYGFWGKLFPWQTELNTQGRVTHDHFVPVEYDVHDLWGKKSHATKLVFTRNDIKASYDPPETDNSPDKLTPEQKLGALDPLTAMLQLLAHVDMEKNCNTTVAVFDGKRRFDIIGEDAGSEYINDDDYNVYKGDARLCDAKFRAVAGEWTEKVKAGFWKKSDSGEDREPFHIWLASIAPGVPELAVRLETGSSFGDIVVHLTAWHYAGVDEVRALSAANAAQKPAKK